MTSLFDAVRRHADAHADADGLAPTAIAGLAAVRATAPSGLVHALSRPIVCLVVQGAKRVTTGARDVTFAAGDSLFITADVPIVSQVTQASLAAPYYSLVLALDPAVIADLAFEMNVRQEAVTVPPVRAEPTDREVADAALRLMRLLDRPDARPVLQASLVREMHYWLMAGRHGAAIRQLGRPEGHAPRVARAVALLRTTYAQKWPVEQLAAEAGMSPASFHRHFRAVTSLSPLQFQKQLRLIEAKRLMLADGVPVSSAAYAVGYESVPQFVREYGRLFGQPPARDVEAARRQVAAVA